MTTTPRLCTTCRFCKAAPSNNLNEGTCDAVEDPWTGVALNVKVARLDEWAGLFLPCGFAGNLWQEKT